MALERIMNTLKRGLGDATIKQLYEYSSKNKLCLEDSIIKLLELNQLKPKIKTLIKQLIRID